MIKQREANSWKSVSYAKSITGAQTYTKFPIVLRTTEQSIPTWSMDGNVETSGTPSPTSPIIINGCGDQTANLSSGSIANSVINTSGVVEANQNYTTIYAPVTAGQTYTFGYTASNVDVNYIYGFFTVLPSIGSTTYNNSRTVVSYSTSSTVTFEAPSGVSYIGMRIPNAAITVGNFIMINEGSVLQPYEPLGYKISVVSNSTTLSPIYLSEPLMKIGDTVDSLTSTGTVTYNIKKLVLTGEEQWSAHQSGNGLYSLSDVNDYLVRNINISICSHYNTIENVSGYSAVTDKTVTFYALTGSSVRVMYLRDTDFANVTALKSFLSNQYAAGTPVTVYYILATPTTETVTVPSIPTTSGLNTIDVNTTVKPSEMSLTYDGYKLCKGQRYSRTENLFDFNTMATGVLSSYLKSDGSIQSQGGWNVSDYIPCNGTDFTLTMLSGGVAPSICLYNSEKQYIAGVAYNGNAIIVINAITNASYIRISLRTTWTKNDVMLNEGSTAKPYQPYLDWE